MTAQDLRVSVLGYGAIGARVAGAIARAEIPGVTLVGAIVRTPGRAGGGGERARDLTEALAESDLIVECATGEALRVAGPQIIAAGVALLPASLGALADPDLRARLIEKGPGRCYLTAGAIGGLDLLGAAARDGGLEAVTLTSTKRARTLVQPWMTVAEAERLRDAEGAFTLFEGSVQDAIARFPASLNVGVALAAATGLWDTVRVRLVADPTAELTSHRITATGAAGEYDFSITNKPLATSPASSGVVSAALLRGVAQIARPSGAFV
ncbi:aspartate dehydrogenase domain-containing protein [Leucobacter sp. HY1908]